MAETAKKTTAKRTAKKAPAKKATARTTTARTTAAKPAVEQSPLDAVTDQLKNVEDRAERFVESASARIESAAGDVVKFARDMAHTYIGVGLVVQDRIVKRSGEHAQYANFLEEAKERGHSQVSEIQARIEPLFERVTERFEPITDRIEAQLPEQVREAIESGRERVRKLVAA